MCVQNLRALGLPAEREGGTSALQDTRVSGLSRSRYESPTLPSGLSRSSRAGAVSREEQCHAKRLTDDGEVESKGSVDSVVAVEVDDETLELDPA